MISRNLFSIPTSHLISKSLLTSRSFSTTQSLKMPVKPVASLPDFNSSIAFEGLTVVDFFATWCGPCKAISPVLDRLSGQFTQAQFIKVDVDQASDIAREYGISAMPTFFFFKKGEKIGEVVGANPQKLQAFISSNA